MILANPPFGKKGGYTIVGEDGKITTEKQEYEREDFWATTANKQLNFLQHIVSELAIGGSAAVVLPDNVLFSKAEQAKPSAASCSSAATSTPSFDFLPASSTPRA